MFTSRVLVHEFFVEIGVPHDGMI
ncbi:hypothetical protein A2U01_0114638, partial [Trifolium medium]|nr:hypothetical protein [Trifolium medium]